MSHKNTCKSNYFKGPKKKHRKDPMENYIHPHKVAPKEVKKHRRLEQCREDIETYGVYWHEDY